MIDPHITTAITNEINTAFIRVANTWPNRSKHDIVTAAHDLTVAVVANDSDTILEAACAEILAATETHPEAGRVIEEARNTALNDLSNAWPTLVKDGALYGTEIHHQLHAEVQEITRTTSCLVNHDDALGRESLAMSAAWAATIASLRKVYNHE